jgi:hypothetical protein
MPKPVPLPRCAACKENMDLVVLAGLTKIYACKNCGATQVVPPAT